VLPLVSGERNVRTSEGDNSGGNDGWMGNPPSQSL